ITGSELAGKSIAVLGVGRVSKEVIKRARAFEMIPHGFDLYWDHDFAKLCDVRRCQSADEALLDADIISLHMNLNDENREFINKDRIAKMKRGAVIINTARGGLVNEQDIADACKSGHLRGY